MTKPGLPPEERFWMYVDKTDGCWLWVGAGGKYGHFQIKPGVKTSTHRFSYALARGPIPNGMWVCHHCDTPRCIRPSHLFLGDRAANMKDAYAKGRTSLQQPGVLPRGETHHKAKLTWAKVHAIRTERATGAKQYALARKYEVSQATINGVVNFTYWRDDPLELSQDTAA